MHFSQINTKIDPFMELISDSEVYVDNYLPATTVEGRLLADLACLPVTDDNPVEITSMTATRCIHDTTGFARLVMYLVT